MIMPCTAICPVLSGRFPCWAFVMAPNTLRRSLAEKWPNPAAGNTERPGSGSIDLEDPLFSGVQAESQVWMSHADTITKLPEGFELIAGTESIEVAAFKSSPGRFDFPVYCLQFHPEVTHSLQGKTILENFVVKIAGTEQSWSPASFVKQTVAELKTQLGTDRVIMGLVRRGGFLGGGNAFAPRCWSNNSPAYL